MSYKYPYGSTLPENGVIGRGYALISDNRHNELRVTQDGNIELWFENKRKSWSVDGENVSWVKMQTDGNCVAYNPDGFPVWATKTNGDKHPYSLVCQSDGNLVLYAEGSIGVWQSNTAVF